MIALALIDGSVSFESTHSYERMSDPEVLAVKERVSLVPSTALMDREAPRSAKVEVVLKDGRTVEHFTPHAYGTSQNPMDTENVNKKSRDLLEPVLGAARTEEIIRRVNELEKVSNVNELMPSLTLTPEEMARVRYEH
jgi:2-methylcitrate dehydratase PrpD